MITAGRQAAVAADLAAYFGPNAEIYLHHYARMVRETKLFPWSWNWAGFLTGYAWFFYRRMNGAAFVLLIMPIILFPLMQAGTGLGIAIALGGIQSKSLYVHQGFRHILQADRMSLTGDERTWYLRSKGGVSRAAAFFAGAFLFITSVIGVLVIVSALDGAPSTPRFRNA